MQTVKAGDKFKLGHWVWKVDYVNECIFTAKIYDYKSPGAILTWQIGQAHALDWINESATISKEARDEIVEWSIANLTGLDARGLLAQKLDSMTKES